MESIGSSPNTEGVVEDVFLEKMAGFDHKTVPDRQRPSMGRESEDLAIDGVSSNCADFMLRYSSFVSIHIPDELMREEQTKALHLELKE